MLFKLFARSAAPVVSKAASHGPAPGPAQPLKLSLASATREYDQAVAGGTIDRLTVRDLERLQRAMQPDIWAWQRARRLVSQTPWRASPNVAERIERTRAEALMTSDIPLWERALAELDAERRRVALYGKDPPAPLDVPAEILRLIEQRRAATLERAARRRTGSETGGGPVPRPDEALDHPPLPTKPADPSSSPS